MKLILRKLDPSRLLARGKTTAPATTGANRGKTPHGASLNGGGSASLQYALVTLCC
ncbi:MAG TPA: hypothetical protein VF457_07835 [Burkholderiaceae bacterium]